MSAHPIFSIAYSQPAEYRFSLDSVEAPAAVADWWRERSAEVNGRDEPSPIAGDTKQVEARGALRVLDVCAGSGVMGLELAFHLPFAFEIDFVEVQAVYGEHFARNAEAMQNLKRVRGEELSCHWLERNYAALGKEFGNRYDLILANPPYFRPEQGKSSPNDFKNRCRFFLDASPEALWDLIVRALKPGASAFALVRDLGDHGWNPVEEIRQRLRYQAKVEKWRDIRGTHLLQIEKRVEER